jgi:fumarate reductase subunit D
MSDLMLIVQSIKYWSEKYAGPLLIAYFAAIAPIHTILTVVGLLIFGDLILGVWAAQKRGEIITSARLRDTVSKMFIYHVVIALGFAVEAHILNEFIPIVKMSASVIGIVELKSIYENSGSILGKPLFKDLISKLGSKNRD